MTAVNKAFDWITKMAFLNILWLFFLIPGLVVFGLFPSTAALFTIIRKWLSGETEIPVFKTFWKTYKKEFINSNKLGYILAAGSYVLYLDFLFLTSSSNEMIGFLTIPYLLVAILFLLTAMYAFPVFIHYEMKTLQVIKSAFFMALLNPMSTLIMLIGTGGMGFVFWKFQGLALFFSFSILALVIMMPAHQAFENVKVKSERYLKTSKKVVFK